MKRLLILNLILLSSINAYKIYELLPSAHEYKIVIKEIEHTSIEGFDSDGKLSTHHFTQSRERYMAPKDAFDLGIRYQEIPIVRESLCKLELFNEAIDITAALNVIGDKLLEAKASKKARYWFSGIIGSCAALPWFLSNNHDNNLIMSGFMGGIAILNAVLNHFEFKRTSQVYTAMIHMLLNSDACIVKNKKSLKRTLLNIQSLLTQEDQIKFEKLLINL